MTTDNVTAEQIAAGEKAIRVIPGGQFWAELLPRIYVAMRALEPSPKDEGMREALQPFADRADNIEAQYTRPVDGRTSWSVSLDDLRAARAALAAISSQPGDEETNDG